MLLSGMACTVLAQDVEVPHTFQAGTPARAVEVNANFTALAEAINANQAAIQGLQDGGALQQIGTLSISAAPYNGVAIPIFLFQWDNTYESSGGAGGGGGSATFGGITVSKLVGAFSPRLFLDFSTAKSIPEATIQLTSPDSIVTSYILKDPVISGYGAATDRGTGVLETITFSYVRLTISTTDPASSATPTACFDISLNESC